MKRFVRPNSSCGRRIGHAAVVFLIAGMPAFAGFLVNFFPSSDYNSNTAAMDAVLGITGYQIDSFESITLLPGLTSSMNGGTIGSPATLTSLAKLYDANSQSVTTNNNWDGPNVMVNNPDNSVPNPSVSPAAMLTTFNYAPGTTAFGVGLSNFQSLDSPTFPVTNHDLFINGVDMGTIETLAGSLWSPGLLRNAYVVIDATGGSVINSVGFQNNSGADVLVFDHLAIQSATAIPEPNTFLLLALGSATLGLVRIARSPGHR